MKFNEVMEYLKSKGNPGTKEIYIKHGAKEPFFGVKVGDLKPLQKKIKKDYELSKELFDSMNSDAMYLAGLIADESKMSKSDLDKWAKNAYWYMLSEYTVAWVASESRFGIELGLKWIDSAKENIATSGWATLANAALIKDDSDLPLDIYSDLIKRVEDEIHNAQNRVRYTMNGFIISAGSSIKTLNPLAEKAALNIGKVKVNIGKTSCKVPFAPEYIAKIKNMGKLGKKKNKLDVNTECLPQY